MQREVKQKLTQEEIRRIAREENNRYLREWRRKNPEKVSAINARYREKQREKAEGEVSWLYAL